MSLLVRDCSWIVIQDSARTVLKDASVYVEDGKITEIGRGTSHGGDHVIDGHGMILLPGLVNMHTHVPMVIFRGYADDMLLQDWLSDRIWKLEPNMTEETCYWGTMLGCLEMIASGTTTFNDMYFFVKSVAKAVHDVGIRAVLSSVIIDYTPDPKLHRENASKVLDYLKEIRNPLLTAAIAPHSVYSCSEETLQWAKTRADKEHVLVHTHIAETRKEQGDIENKLGLRVVEYLDRIGFLGANVVGAHCGWVSIKEVKLLGESGTKVAHCPVSNMKLAVGGAAPLPEMFESHVCVGLGTDGAASNNTLDMFETMKFCALLHKHTRWDPTILPAQTTLDLATRDGARALGMEETIGSIEVGKSADMILLDTRAPNMMPIHGKDTVISDLVYSASGANVDTTIVNGKVLMEKRRFKMLDAQNVADNVDRVTQDLLVRSQKT
jgi:5-methylthioadenosine/S-adenosylhomocysteine deaminase